MKGATVSSRTVATSLTTFEIISVVPDETAEISNKSVPVAKTTPPELPTDRISKVPVVEPKAIEVASRSEPISSAASVLQAEHPGNEVASMPSVDTSDSVGNGSYALNNDLASAPTDGLSSAAECSGVAYQKTALPKYPKSARNKRQEGLVILAVNVNSQGDACSVNVKQSSGFEVLDKAAEQSVAEWKFVPAMQGGEPVASWVDVPVRFTLNNVAQKSSKRL